MKKLLPFIYTCLVCLTAQAQQTPVSDGYLTDGDYVTISFCTSYWDNQGQKHDQYNSLEASTSGLLTQTVPSNSCLWQIGIQAVNSGYAYTFLDLTTNRYLNLMDYGNNSYGLTLTTSPTAFYFSEATDGGADRSSEEDAYRYGKLYYNTSQNGQTIPIYFNYTEGTPPYSFTTTVWWGRDFYIEKWDKQGADAPQGGFSIQELVFPYATADTAANQATDVTFTLPTQTNLSYQCIHRPDWIIGGGVGDVDENDITNLKFYWESSNLTTSKIIQSDYYDDPTDSYTLPADKQDVLNMTLGASSGKQVQFTITPAGESPMNLRTNINSRIQWVNYADRVVAEYQYKGNTVTQTMRVVRNSYHEEQLPPLTFHVNPTMFTFGADAETVNITVVPIHQHGTVMYDVNNMVYGDIQYESNEYPERISITDKNWNFTVTFSDNWISYTIENDSTIAVTATAGSNRSATLTGSVSNTLGQHQHYETFTIPLSQREDAGIKFYHKGGQGAQPQQVHTTTRTIYYLPNERIELRLAESNFFGYMRWYDYKTGKAPNYNFGDGYYYSTSWYTTPRGANNQPFTPINTPASAATEGDEGRSWGLYAINHHHGGILNEGTENSNNIPVLNGWDYKYTKGQTYPTEQAKRAAGYHTIACDLSAYTDYEIVKDQTTGLVTSITEPTLSYRQLFDLRPAGEMADKFAKLENDKYLEEYNYQAPAGVNVLLTPQFKYRQGTDQYLSKLCYFYWENSTLVRVTNATWQGDGILSDNGEYITVSGTAGTTKTYTLTANNGDVRIAKFTVTFTDPLVTGPSKVVLKSKQEMEFSYNLLEYIDFNHSDANKKITLADDNTYYNQPLNWTESTYGYVHPDGKLATPTTNSVHGYVRAANQGVFPFYGEYCLVNKVYKDWSGPGISAEQHGGATNGFALYVDGTTEPGLVASIEAKANICTGQTMYCSAWFCNPSSYNHEGSTPTFRCNVQGKKEGGDWEDAGVFFVGSIAKRIQGQSLADWYQIVFPINTAHSYDSTRVSIYNFATSGAANDFLVDDIALFVSQLPIAAYQGKMACRSTGTETTSAAAVLRLDYSNINAGDDGFMCYQIYNESYDEDGDDKADGAPVNLTGDAAYYHEAHQGGEHIGEDSYGSVHIPVTDFDPIAENTKLKSEEKDTLLIYGSVSKLLDEMAASGLKHAKAYVKTENDSVTKWLLYVAHIVENTRTNDNKEALQMLYDQHHYSMRMAYTPEELENADCNMTTPLHATQQTVFDLRNSSNQVIKHSNRVDVTGKLSVDAEGEETMFFTNLHDNCANDLYFLTAKVVNHLALGTGGNLDNPITAPIYADWLVGEEFDDPYTKGRPASNSDEKKDIDAKFVEKYGYTRGQVATAIMYDMRRKSPDNPNYAAETFGELEPTAFLSQQNYTIVKHLYDNGWLQMYDTTMHFYLDSAGVARYWCFPIEGTAKTTIEDQKGNKVEYVVKDCNEPRWVKVTANNSSAYVNISPIAKADKSPLQKLQLPTVKVLASKVQTEIKIPVKESNSQINGLSIETDATTGNQYITIAPNNNYISFFDLERGKVIDAPASLNPGEEHTLRLTLENNGTPTEGCPTGYIFCNIAIVPDILVWQPTESSFNGWGKNENWKGWVDTNEDGIPNDGDTFTDGYVPMGGADVVIPKLDNPMLYPYIVPEHEHNHYPMTVYHDQHKCRYIYLAEGAHLDNQHLLEYEKAFVDMPIPAGGWNMMSAPLQSMYTGDIYVPHTGDWQTWEEKESKNPFKVSSFDGNRSPDAAYVFWQAFYNQTLSVQQHSGVVEKTGTTAFQSTNALNQSHQPGSGFQVYGLGPGETGDKGTITVRLPKPDDTYYYYSQSGKIEDSAVVLDRNYQGRFAFTADHNSDAMQIQLTNAEESEHFIFGNPTMAFINMHTFLNDEANKDSLNHVFYRLKGSTWLSSTELTMSEDRYLAPMTSVKLETKKKSKNLTLTLKVEHLTLNNQVSATTDIPAQLPAKYKMQARYAEATSRSSESELMTIYAFIDGAYARTILATNPIANDYYQSGEDALFLSSGIESESYVTTPLNMYTVAERVPMMADVRQGISRIPLSMLVAPDYRSERMKLAFYLSINWTRECYLYDSATGNYTRILNGLVVDIEMPENHEERYYIEGPDEYLGSSDDQGPTTAVDNTVSSSASATLQAFSLAQGELTIGSNQLIQEIRLYDLAGRLILDNPLTLLHTTTTVTAPSGICLVEAVLRDGTTLHTQALVK